MPSPTLLSRGLLAMCLCAAGLAAQQRVATAGRVLDGSGDPLARAEVVFVGSEPPLGDRFGGADRVVATTDGRGRFRAELLPGSEYCCWAAGPPDREGSRRVSEVRDGVRAGTGVELRAPHSRSASQLRLVGLEAWPDLGPLRCEVGVAVAHLHRQPLAFTDGLAELPTLPIGAAWFVFVRDGQDQTLYAAQLAPQRGVVRLPVPPPRRIPVRVLDADGAPVAGATLRTEVAGLLWRDQSNLLAGAARPTEWRDLGTTDADGTATVQVACREDPFAAAGASAPLLLACTPEHAAAVSGWNGNLIVNGRGIDRLEGRELPFTLRKASPMHGTLRDELGRPLAGVQVALTSQLLLKMAKGGTLHSPIEFRTRAGADGTFVFDGLPTELGVATLLLDVPRAAASAPASTVSMRAPPPHEPRLVGAPGLLAPVPGAPLAIDLGKLPLLRMAVRDLSGGPARHADVVMLPLPVGPRELHDATHRFQLDAAGTARTRVQAVRWAVFATDRIGWALTLLDVTYSQDVALALQELAVVRGRVMVEKTAEPPPIEFHVNSIKHKSSSADEPAMVMRAIGTQLNQWLAKRTQVSADGAFELRFLDVPGTEYRGGVQAGLSKAVLKLQASEEPVEFDLRGKAR